MMDDKIRAVAQRIKECEQEIREADVIMRAAATDMARRGDANGLRNLAVLLPEYHKYEARPGVTTVYVTTREIFERTAAEIEAGKIPAQYLLNIDFNR